jgi:hypothetical protein
MEIRMSTRVKMAGVFALLTLLGIVDPAQACGRRATVCYSPCYPVWPCPPVDCCPPDTNPIHPVPAHPTPHGSQVSKLTLKNPTYSQAFVIIYIRYADGIYRPHEKKLLDAGTVVAMAQTYYAGDSLLVETWFRGTPHDHWHCHPARLVNPIDPSGTFDVFRGTYTSP